MFGFESGMRTPLSVRESCDYQAGLAVDRSTSPRRGEYGFSQGQVRLFVDAGD
jgi:hypothetical protein